MLAYQALTGIPLEPIHHCFVEAFSDYQVKIDMPIEKLRLMLKRRGFTPGLSVGAMADGVLVGLILNGRRPWNGVDTIYDAGTGVIPQYRRQGITNAMFLEVLKLCKALGIKQYLLEVIRTNTPAVELYQKQEFAITRTFNCFRAPKERIPTVAASEVETVDRVESLDWGLLRSFCDFEPSWQNSVASILAVPDVFAAVLAKQDGQTVGYGVVDMKTGDVPQLAVAKPFRGRGAGRSILNALSGHAVAASLSILNVDAACQSACGFLEKSGFEMFVGQYEMELFL